MLHSAKEMRGLTIAATDGEFGTIDDLYFDDVQWTVRYLVVNTGGWITGRNVLVPINAVVGAGWPEENIQVKLTKEQIQNSPGIDTDKPVSRQHEADAYKHYGYPDYWSGPYLWGRAVFPTLFEDKPFEDQERQDRRQRMEQKGAGANPHLRSSKEVNGYTVQATDDTVGHIEDFLFDDKDWSIQLVAVDTANWLPGKEVLISPQRIGRVSWEDNKVFVDLSRDAVENSPEYDPANPPPLGPKYDLFRRFGTPHG
jgi:uncharacterized protein YrrD